MRELDYQRRRLLALTGAGLTAGIAGCTGGDNGDGDDGSDGDDGGDGSDGGNGADTTPDTDDGTPTPSTAGIHLLTDYANEPWQSRWEDEIVPAFEDQTGIDVEVEYVGFHGTGEDRLTTLLQSGEAPVTFTGNITQNGDLLGQGHLAPTTDTVQTLIEQNGDLIAPGVTVRGDYYIVPHGRYMSTIHYRADILDQLGLDPPETLEQLLHNARVIDEADDVDARGFAMPGQKTGQSGTIYLILLYQYGANFYRWADKDAGVAEVWFPKDEAVEVLEYMRELAQYSPDPSQINWGPTLSLWAGGRVAQAYSLNAWGAGVAASAGATAVAENTDLVPFPVKEGVEPFNGNRGFAGYDGHSVIGSAENPEGFKRLLEFMYSDPEESAKNYITEPMRMLPAYEDILEADTYQSASVFEEIPHLLDLNQKSLEYGPLQPSGEDAVYSPAAVYTNRFFMIAEMVNQVLVAGRDPGPAFDEAKQLTVQRFQEGQQLVEENFG